jgi:hypothetical protein
MTAKKGPGDLNAPLRSLSERLRSLQRETGEMLAAARSRPRRKRSESSGASEPARPPVADNPLLRAAATLLDRWDVPTRADIDAIRARLDRIEAALAIQQEPDATPAAAKPRKAAAKTRRKPQSDSRS